MRETGWHYRRNDNPDHKCPQSNKPAPYGSPDLATCPECKGRIFLTATGRFMVHFRQVVRP